MHKLTVLDNGITLITEALPYAASFSFGVINKTGARYEEAAYNGHAHFIEHMLFQGTKSRTAERIINDIEDKGGDLTAFTSVAMTSYTCRVMAEDAMLAVDVVSDMLMNPTFENDKIERERDIIIEELSLAQSRYEWRFVHAVNAAMFPDQAFSHRVLGTRDTIGSANRQTLTDFWDQHYHHSDMVIGAVGRFDHDRIVDYLSCAFSSVEPRKQITPEKAVYHPGQLYMQEALEHVGVKLCFEGLKNDDLQDMATLTVLKNILGGGMSSRLFTELREKRGYAYNASASILAYPDIGVFSMTCDTTSSKLQDAVAVMCDTVNQLKDKNAYTHEEIQRAKNYHKAGLVFTHDAPIARLEEFMHMMHDLGKIVPVEEEMAYVDAVDAEKLQDMAQRIFVPDCLFAAAIGDVTKMESRDVIQSRLKL